MIPTDTLISDIVSIIEYHKLFYIVDIFAFYNKCSRKTFYERNLHKSDIIKEALEKNRVITVQMLKSRWAEKDAAPVLQIALFKTISSESDLRKLSQSWQHVDGDIKLKKNIADIFPEELDKD